MRAFSNIKKLIFGWGIMVPISCLVPKKKNLILFVGKNKGQFLDNIKYLYLYLHRLKKNNISYYFFTTKKATYRILKQNDLPAVFHPSLLSIYVLLRANILIVGDRPWVRKYKYHISFRSKKVQLWHGVGFKKIGLAIQSNNSLANRVHNAIRGNSPIHDLFVSTSEFYTENVFSNAFKAKRFLESGYPRNDIFFNGRVDKYDLLGADEKTISKIQRLRSDGYKIVLYAPTFRDIARDTADNKPFNLKSLSGFAKKYKTIFIFKLHAYVSAAIRPKAYNNIIEYDNTKDIQPLLKISDILITDYSSVYMDYLLLDRPVIFFFFFYEKYTQKDRGLIFDYESMTPGPKCYSQGEVQKALICYITGQKDDFSVKRKELRNLAFKYQDGRSSKRIWNFIEENYINS